MPREPMPRLKKKGIEDIELYEPAIYHRWESELYQ